MNEVDLDSGSADRALADVRDLGRVGVVRLPARLAKAAVAHLMLENLRLASCEVLEGLAEDPGAWGLRVPHASCERVLAPLDKSTDGALDTYRFPRHEVVLFRRYVPWLLAALEAVKPDALDAEGRPLPWVEGLSATETLGIVPGVDAEEVTQTATDPGPATPDAPASEPPIRDAEIRAHFDRFLGVAGLGPVPLTSIRGTVDKCGFTSGRVWHRQDGTPLRVRITTCPNSDLAEILATLLHELAHVLVRSADHGAPFKNALVDLAERCFPGDRFLGARQNLDEGYHVLDAWVTACIRQTLIGQDPPLPQTDDELGMAEIAARVRKARALGADRCGSWEGIRATAVANQLVTLYGMNDYRVRIESRLLDRMVDRWIVIANKDMWRRSLAHEIARAFDVCSLGSAHRTRGIRMHFFGRQSDVAQAEYLFALTQQRIEAACERHLDALRSKRVLRDAGAARSERTSFCDSAVLAFHKRLRKLAASDAAEERTRSAEAVERARAFAFAEHQKRGISWGSGRARTIRANAAGHRLGESLELTRGVGGEPQKRLAGPSDLSR